MHGNRKLIFGVGINDADYITQPTINGKRAVCHFYDKWKCMLQRCYSEKFQSRRKTYIGCSVSPDWVTFSNFKSWMEKQDWQGKHLDKDLLFKGNKVYSPENCVFVDHVTNSFTLDCGAVKGEFSIGIYFNNREGKYQAKCSNPFTKKCESLGYFRCQELAHQAWRKRKHELACQLAGLQTDERVAEALRSRYL